LSPTTCEAAAVGADPLDLLGGFDQRRDAGRRVGFVGILHGYTDAGACLEIDGMLGFVGEVRPAVLHLRDLRVGVVRMRPVVVRLPGPRVGVSMPEACASLIKKSWSLSPESRRTMLRSAALASSVVLSIVTQLSLYLTMFQH
jgi:hypothetical protein